MLKSVYGSLRLSTLLAFLCASNCVLISYSTDVKMTVLSAEKIWIIDEHHERWYASIVTLELDTCMC